MKLFDKIIPACCYLLVTVPAQAATPDQGQLSCLLQPSEEIRLANDVAGIVREISVDRGDTVKKGDVLLVLEQGVEESAVNLAKAKVEFLERKLNRNRELIDQGLIADHEADQIVTDRDIAALELQLAERKLAQRTIYSPVNAVVVDRLVSKAEYAGTDPLMVLAVLDPIHAEIVISAEYYGTVSKGMKVNVIPEGGQYGEFAGKVSIVDQIIDAASGTFGIQVEIRNPGLKLPAGLKCRIAFNQ